MFYAGRKSERGPSSSFLLAMVGLYVLFIVGHELFRWGYYGEWLPNTYTLKVSGILLFARVVNGIGYVEVFLKEVYVLSIVAGAGMVFAFRRDKLFLASLFVVLVCYQVWAGGDVDSYWRLLSPVVPIMLVLGAHEIFTAVQYLFARRYSLRNPSFLRRHVPGFLTCLLVLTVLWSVNSRFLPEIAMFQRTFESDVMVSSVNTALAIERFTTPDATLGVLSAGTIPYYSERPALDFLGKMDRRIARLAPDLSSGVGADPTFNRMVYEPGHNKYDLEYSIKELRPTYAEGFRWGEQNVLDWAESEYVKVDYEGERLYLLEDSEHVRWDDVEAAREGDEVIIGTPTADIRWE